MTTHLSRPPRPAPHATGAERVLYACTVREDLEALVTDHATTLQEHVRGLRVWRAFADGAWVVGVHAGGRLEGLPFSRLDFELRIDAGDHTVELTARTTVRGRDLESRVVRITVDPTRREQLAAFVEQAFLSYAEELFRGEGS